MEGADLVFAMHLWRDWCLCTFTWVQPPRAQGGRAASSSLSLWQSETAPILSPPCHGGSAPSGPRGNVPSPQGLKIFTRSADRGITFAKLWLVVCSMKSS